MNILFSSKNRFTVHPICLSCAPIHSPLHPENKHSILKHIFHSSNLQFIVHKDQFLCFCFEIFWSCYILQHSKTKRRVNCCQKTTKFAKRQPNLISNILIPRLKFLKKDKNSRSRKLLPKLQYSVQRSCHKEYTSEYESPISHGC